MSTPCARHLVRAAAVSTIGVLGYQLSDDSPKQVIRCESTEKQLTDLTSSVSDLSKKLDILLQTQERESFPKPMQLGGGKGNLVPIPTLPAGSSNARVTRVVLTGGPCGGKSSCLSSVEQHLTELGYHVYIVPEASTMLKTSGYGFPGAPGTSRAVQLAWEEQKMRLQIMLEDMFVQIGWWNNWKIVDICRRLNVMTDN